MIMHMQMIVYMQMIMHMWMIVYMNIPDVLTYTHTYLHVYFPANTYFLTYLPTYLLTCPPTYLCVRTCFFACLLVWLLTCWLTFLSLHLITCLLAGLLACLLIVRTPSQHYTYWHHHLCDDLSQQLLACMLTHMLLPQTVLHPMGSYLGCALPGMQC